MSGACQSLGGFAAQVFNFGRGFTLLLLQIASWLSNRIPDKQTPPETDETNGAQPDQVCPACLVSWESSGRQNEQEGLIPTTNCWAQCRHHREQFTGLSAPQRVRLSNHNGPFWL